MKVGSLVKVKPGVNTTATGVWFVRNGIGIVTKRVGKEMAYVYWGGGKPEPINIRIIEKL
jgi:hypothetical protein